MAKIAKKLYELLLSLDTPTICNAIEIAQGKRGFANFSKTTVKAAIPEAPPLLGFALTAKIKGRIKPTLPPNTIKKIRMDYYKYMSRGKRPAICVIEDTDHPKAVSAFWGELNTWIHKGFTISGTVTNGVMRDLDNLAPNYQVIANSIGPSHSFVHVTEINIPVEVFDVRVKPNDLIYADKHGIVNIPLNLINDLEKSIRSLLEHEKIILDAAKDKDFTFEKFSKAWEKFEKLRT